MALYDMTLDNLSYIALHLSNRGEQMAKPISLYLPTEVVARIDSLAEAEERSRNYVATKLLSEALSRAGANSREEESQAVSA